MITLILIFLLIFIFLCELINWINLKRKKKLIKYYNKKTNQLIKYKLYEFYENPILGSDYNEIHEKFTFIKYLLYFPSELITLKKIKLIFNFKDEKYKFWFFIIVLLVILLITGIMNLDQIINLIISIK